MVHFPSSGTTRLNPPLASVSAERAVDPQVKSTFTPLAIGLPASVIVPEIFPAKLQVASPRIISRIKAVRFIVFPPALNDISIGRGSVEQVCLRHAFGNPAGQTIHASYVTFS